MKQRIAVILLIACVFSIRAEDILVSWESNGVLVATGMEPKTSYAVEWSSNLGNGFTNVSPNFEGLVADSNGTGRVEIPMFFRVSGTMEGTIPEGMVLIPGGTNSGTNPLGDGESYGFWCPETYSLTVDSFCMDQYEVTKAQWDTVYSWAVTNGYSFDNIGAGRGSNHPVQAINWYDCVKWCNARSEKEGKTPCYNLVDWSCDYSSSGYRLPTSDEWEYAARGGLEGKRFPWGDTITHNEANYKSWSSISYDISPTRDYHPSYYVGAMPYTSPVGRFPPNGYKLYDISGNVGNGVTSPRYRAAGTEAGVGVVAVVVHVAATGSGETRATDSVPLGSGQSSVKNHPAVTSALRQTTPAFKPK